MREIRLSFDGLAIGFSDLAHAIECRTHGEQCRCLIVEFIGTNIDHWNQRWGKILVWIGPLSWLVTAIYVLICNREMWAGLAALYIAIPISLVIHVIAPLALVILVFHRRRRGQRIGKMLRWGLVYYALIPFIILAISIWLQGFSGTLAWVEMVVREIVFQINK